MLAAAMPYAPPSTSRCDSNERVENVVYAPRRPIVSVERSQDGAEDLLGEHGEEQAEQERSADVDDEGSPREAACRPSADQPVEPVARQRSDRAGDCD